MTCPSDATAQTERSLLGSVLMDNSLWPQTAELSVQDFSLDWNRRIYARMAAMLEDGRPVDLITLTDELDKQKELERCGSAAYVSDLLTPQFERNSFAEYVRRVREASKDRRFNRLQEQLLE